MHGYGSLSLITVVWFFVWILWIFLLVRILGDVLRSPDLSGNAKAGWTLLLVLVPFIGSLAYLVVRGGEQNVYHHYLEQALRPGATTTDELVSLAGLRDRGALTDAEFATQKQRVLAGAFGHGPAGPS